MLAKAWRFLFLYFNNGLEGNAILTIWAILEELAGV